jgi:hypothetical protein
VSNGEECGDEGGEAVSRMDNKKIGLRVWYKVEDSIKKVKYRYEYQEGIHCAIPYTMILLVG